MLLLTLHHILMYSLPLLSQKLKYVIYLVCQLCTLFLLLLVPSPFQMLAMIIYLFPVAVFQLFVVTTPRKRVWSWALPTTFIFSPMIMLTVLPPKASDSFVLCFGYFIFLVPTISGKHSLIHDLGRHLTADVSTQQTISAKIWHALEFYFTKHISLTQFCNEYREVLHLNSLWFVIWILCYILINVCSQY